MGFYISVYRSFPSIKCIRSIIFEASISESFESSLNQIMGLNCPSGIFDRSQTKIKHGLLKNILNTEQKCFLLFGCLSPAHENHSLFAAENSCSVIFLHPIHHMQDLPLHFLACISSNFNILLLLLFLKRCLIFIMLNFLVDFVRLYLNLLHLFKSLSLSIFTHEFNEDSADILELNSFIMF